MGREAQGRDHTANSAVRWFLDATTAHGPLLLDGQPVVIGYTDNNRTQQRHGTGGGDHGSLAENDWVCVQVGGEAV